MSGEEAIIVDYNENTPLIHSYSERPEAASSPKKCQVMFDSVIARMYLNPYLLHQEQTMRVSKDTKLPPKIEAIRDAVMNELQNGHSEGNVLDSFQGGELSMCGSMAEGMKVGGADEFDFQYLLTVDGLEANHKRLYRTKPRSANQESQSFFSLNFHHSDGSSEELVASQIHDRFLHRVQRLVSEIGDFEIKKAGPAVKISYTDENGHTIKIDLTLGLRASDENTAHLKLTTLAEDLRAKGCFRCHFVAAHDYWKICYVETEQDLLREVTQDDDIKGAVYRIIKLLRDEADIKDPYGDGILPSYPIKVTFLDIAYRDHTRGITWSIQDVTFHVIKILREVERRGQNHTLCSLFLAGDDVMSEADRSYLESRRLLKELKTREQFYTSLREQTCFYMGALVLTMFGLLVLKRLDPVDHRSYDNGVVSIIFSLFCVYTLYLALWKKELIFRLYPYLVIQHCIQFVISTPTIVFFLFLGGPLQFGKYNLLGIV